jgi:uncharacterized membrane protein YbhN (UPF0104 family)
MDSATTIAPETVPSAAPVTSPRKWRFGNPSGWFQVIIFLLGVWLFVVVVTREGFRSLIDTTSRIGWGILIVIALHGLRHLVRSVSTFIAIPAHHRSFKFRFALAARLAGDAVGFLTFTGPVLGETTKAAMLKRRVPLSHGAAAVIVENLIYFVSVAVIILLGVLAAVLSYEHTGMILRYTMIFSTIGGVLFLAVVALVLWFRVKPLSWMTRKFSRLMPNAVLSKEAGINAMEGNIYEFYSTRPAAFASIFGLSMLTHLISVIEIYLIIDMLAYVPKINAAFIAESLTKVINFAFGLVPGGVGVYEGGSGMIFKRLEYTVALGVAIALIRRVGVIFWTAVGLVILLGRVVSHGARKVLKREGDIPASA